MTEYKMTITDELGRVVIVAPMEEMRVNAEAVEDYNDMFTYGDRVYMAGQNRRPKYTIEFKLPHGKLIRTFKHDPLDKGAAAL